MTEDQSKTKHQRRAEYLNRCHFTEWQITPKFDHCSVCPAAINCYQNGSSQPHFLTAECWDGPCKEGK